MTQETFWMGRAAVSMVAFALVAMSLVLFAGNDASGVAAARRYVVKLDATLRFLRSKTTGRQVLTIQVVVALACIAGGLSFGEWPLLLFVPVVAFAPKVFLDQGVAKRVSKLDEQIEPWLNAVANSLKASPSLGEAIASTTTLIPVPMSEEVDVLVKEYELGTPLDRALDNLSERIGSRTLAGTVLALKIARKSGGNLPEMLENAASALRELARLEGVVRAKTAEGKAQTFVIGVIPVPMVLGLHAIDPHFFEPLAQKFVGNLLVAIAVVLWASAILAARKILAVDV